MTKFMVHMPLWRRPDVSLATIMSIKNANTDVSIAVSISPEDPQYAANRSVADSLCDHVIDHANLPLSDKCNAITQAVSGVEWDYLMIMGSDDLVSPNFFDNYDAPIAGKLDAFGFEDLYMYQSGQLYYWEGYGETRRESIGAGRIISRVAVERCGYTLWQTGLSRGIDASMTRMLRKKGYSIPYRKMLEGTMLVDIKNDVSVTGLEEFDQSRLHKVGTPQWLLALYS